MELTLTAMANGGAALGRDEGERVIFVPLTIPGERVRLEIIEDKKRFARGRLLEVLEASPDRVEPICPHFGRCGGCHFQHLAYEAQLRYKEKVIRDQLKRIGGFDPAPVRPALANPEPWAYATETTFFPAADGQLGFWSDEGGQVMAIETCHIIRPALLDLVQDLDLANPDLASLKVRLGADGSAMAIIKTISGEAPSLEVDFPVSVALQMHQGPAAILIGQSHLVHSIKGQDFRVSAGSFFYPSPPAAELLVDEVLRQTALSGTERLLELFCGVGMLTAFLAPKAGGIWAIDADEMAISDAAENLSEADSVNLYQGAVDEILDLLEGTFDVAVVDPPPSGLTGPVLDRLATLSPSLLVYVSADVATLARDGRRLAKKGYDLQAVQPIDMNPQSYHTITVSSWAHRTTQDS